MEQRNKTEIERSETPEALYSAIEKYFAASPKDLSYESAYREALNALIRFRKVYSKLPEKPDHQENAVAGLQDVMDWCVRAIDVVDHIVDDMNRNVIDGFICKLNKLKGLPASGFPEFDKDVWKKAEDRAQRIVDKYQAGKKSPKGLSIYAYCGSRTKYLETASIISSLADVADRKAGKSNKWSHLLARNSIATNPLSKQIEEAHTEMSFYRAVEKIYRLMDSNYTTALAQLDERIIIVVKDWNKLNATNTGSLLDKYDELKGLKFQDRVVRLARAYSIDSIVDTALFGPNQGLAFGDETREALVDGLVETLGNISRKVKASVEQETRGTYKAQRLLASQEAEEFAEASRNKKCPELYLLYVYAMKALQHAKSICMMSRRKEHSSAQDFVLDEVRLAEYVNRLKHYPNLIDYLQQWPKNPGTAIAWLAGRSALEVIIEFTRAITSAVVFAKEERACHGATSYDTLQVSPECDLRFAEWQERVINELCGKTIPKPDVWPSPADIHKECKQVLLRLEDEYNKAEKEAENKAVEMGQDAISNKKNSKLDFFYKIYEKTLKALFSAIIEAMKS